MSSVENQIEEKNFFAAVHQVSMCTECFTFTSISRTCEVGGSGERRVKKVNNVPVLGNREDL